MSLDDYSHARGDDFHACGGRVDHTTEDLAGGALLIGATIVLATPQEAILEIDEVVVSTDGDSVHRVRYAYRFLFEGRMIFGYDRDAKNHPHMPEHKHIGDRRISWGPMPFHDFVNEVWEWIHDRLEQVREE